MLTTVTLHPGLTQEIIWTLQATSDVIPNALEALTTNVVAPKTIRVITRRMTEEDEVVEDAPPVIALTALAGLMTTSTHLALGVATTVRSVQLTATLERITEGA